MGVTGVTKPRFCLTPLPSLPPEKSGHFRHLQTAYVKAMIDAGCFKRTRQADAAIVDVIGAISKGAPQ
jgi:hypothetical protein